jgi:HEAT repeat protein
MPMRTVLAGTVVVFTILFSGCKGQLPPDTGARVRHWIEALRGPDARLRKEAAFKLGNLGLTDPATVVPALTGALKDTDARVRCEAILALVKCGPAAREAMPALNDIRNDPDRQVRAYAGKALKKLRKEGDLSG